MAAACRGLFRALRLAREKDSRWSKLRIHFIGTDYAPPERARPSIAPLAVEEGVGDLVEENPVRVSYATALKSQLQADALILPGSIDSAYSASKIYPLILTKKPLLAIVHEQSPLQQVLAETRAGVVASFNAGTSTDELAREIDLKWFNSGASETIPSTDWKAFLPFTARNMTHKLSAFFDEAIDFCTRRHR